MAVENTPLLDPNHLTDPPTAAEVKGRDNRQETFLQSWKKKRRLDKELVLGISPEDEESADEDKKQDRKKKEKAEASSFKKGMTGVRTALRRIIPAPQTMEASDSSISADNSEKATEAEQAYSWEAWFPPEDQLPAERDGKIPSVAEASLLGEGVKVLPGIESVKPSQTEESSAKQSEIIDRLDTDQPGEKQAVATSRNEAATEEEASSPEEETESLHAILQRHPASPPGGRPPLGPAEAAGAVPPSGDEVMDMYSRSGTSPNVTVNNYEENYYTTRNGGLVALDILNYGLSKRRDNKIERASKKRDEELKRIGERQRIELQRQLDQKDSQQQQIHERTAVLEKNLSDRLPRVRHANSQARGPETLPAQVSKSVVENITTKNVETTSKNHSNSGEQLSARRYPTTEKKVVAAPDVALPSAETILHRVEEAADKNIAIESDYERRHERKGNQDFYVEEASQQTGTMPSGRGGYAHGSQAANQENSTAGAASSSAESESGKDNYREVVTSGAWGVVVGIAIFIVFYILTRG
jgi:hypothetical protein